MNNLSLIECVPGGIINQIGIKRYTQYKQVSVKKHTVVVEIFICLIDVLDITKSIRFLPYPIISCLVVGKVNIVEPNKKLPIIECLKIQSMSKRDHAKIGIRYDPWFLSIIKNIRDNMMAVCQFKAVPNVGMMVSPSSDRKLKFFPYCVPNNNEVRIMANKKPCLKCPIIKHSFL